MQNAAKSTRCGSPNQIRANLNAQAQRNAAERKEVELPANLREPLRLCVRSSHLEQVFVEVIDFKIMRCRAPLPGCFRQQGRLREFREGWRLRCLHL